MRRALSNKVNAADYVFRIEIECFTNVKARKVGMDQYRFFFKMGR